MEEQCTDTEQLKSIKEQLNKAKSLLYEFVYSCVPAEGDLLKGSKTPTPLVAMDVDFDFKGYKRDEIKEKLRDISATKIIPQREQLGLMLLERSAGKGLHIVFKRHLDMTQEENLQWASNLIGCKFDAAAKDITRVFYTTGTEDILYMHPELFLPEMNEGVEAKTEAEDAEVEINENQQAVAESEIADSTPASLTYMGWTYDDIISKYWALYNEGQTPCDGARNALTFELAVNLRAICNNSPQQLMQIIPIYDGLP